MAFNGYFPTGYQPAQQFYYPQQNIVQPNLNGSQQSSSLIWVQGEAGAKSYLVAPNTTVQLWDSENPVIYVKSADASGLPSIRIIDYKFRDANQGTSGTTQEVKKFVTKSEFDNFKVSVENRINEIIGGHNNEHSANNENV